MHKQMLLLVMLFLTACSGEGRNGPDLHIYWINGLKVPCTGVGPMHCLQVQQGETPDPSAWKPFYGTIKGFEFEAGFLYKIVVREKQLDAAKVPADASSIEYTLVKIVEKRPDLRVRLHDIWIVSSLEGKEIKPGTDGLLPELPRLEIRVDEMKYYGNDGCNNLTGGIIELDDSTLKFGVAAGTRKMCRNMQIPDQFNPILQEVASYKINNRKLFLYDIKGEELMQLQKTD